MPTEYREIGFSMSELAKALHSHATTQNPELTLDPPSSIRINGKDELVVAIRFGDQEEDRFSALEVTAALIRHAKAIGVPVARKARKALATKNNMLILKLWMG
ncbi:MULTISPECIES: hypothetical protein [Iodidimonas]|nr:MULTISPECIES: hypothetical protein [Iodidimonas]